MSLSTHDPLPSENNELVIIQLVLQAREGNTAAFELLYKRYFKQLCNYLTHMVGDDGVGCELTQEAFFKAWQALPGLREPATFVGWLYRIATNLALDYKRRTRNFGLESLDVYQDSIKSLCSSISIEQIEAQDSIKMALLRIPWEQRACVILYHMQGVAKDQIAHYVGIKESSVTTYISLGLKKLRQLLAEDNGVAKQNINE